TESPARRNTAARSRRRESIRTRILRFLPSPGPPVLQSPAHAEGRSPTRRQHPCRDPDSGWRWPSPRPSPPPSPSSPPPRPPAPPRRRGRAPRRPPAGAGGAAGGIPRAGRGAPIRSLADALLGGRGPASRGDELARLYLQTTLELLGYQPGGPNGAWQQP